jgi:pimeloyl-ACP methyl ester carboxylesterase
VQLLLDMALYAPERVRALVLLCGGPGRPLDHLHGTPRVGRAFTWLRRVALRWPQTAQAMWTKLLLSDACYAYVHAFEVNGKLLPDEDLRPYFQHLAALDVQLFVRMVTHLQAHTVLPRLAQVRAPTLIVAGEHDTLTPVTLSEHMQQKIPGAELLVVQGGSHVAPLERPALVNARVRSFVQTHEAHSPNQLDDDCGALAPARAQISAQHRPV